MNHMDKINILLVIGYPNLASLYRNILAEEGYNVFVASNGKDAETLISREQIDLAVIDESPPHKNIAGLIDRIRHLLPHPHITLCSMLDGFKYSYFCDDSFVKNSDFTIFQEKINQLSKKIQQSKLFENRMKRIKDRKGISKGNNTK